MLGLRAESAMPPEGSNTILSEDEIEAALAEIESMPEQLDQIPSLDDGQDGDHDAVKVPANAAQPRPTERSTRVTGEQAQPPKKEAKKSPEPQPEPVAAADETVDEGDATPSPRKPLLNLGALLATLRALLPFGRRKAEPETADAAEAATDLLPHTEEADVAEEAESDAPDDAATAPDEDDTEAVDEDEEEYDDLADDAEFVDEEFLEDYKQPWWFPLYVGLDIALDYINRPFLRFGTNFRWAIGIVALVTAILSTAVILTGPSLLREKTAIDFVQEKKVEARMSSPLATPR